MRYRWIPIIQKDRPPKGSTPCFPGQRVVLGVSLAPFYAIMLPRNASHSRKSPESSHVAHVERIAFPERALLELWLQT
jgi:hypothetical protein